MNRHSQHMIREAARIRAKHPLEEYMTELKVIRRSRLRVAALHPQIAALMIEDARQVRRWMRPVRRAIRKLKRRR